MNDHDADAIVAELEQAGLVEAATDEQGREVWTLTTEGERVGNMLAMGR